MFLCEEAWCMARVSSRNMEKASAWRRSIVAQAESGRSVRSWCRLHGVNENSFYWWRRELLKPLHALMTQQVFQSKVIHTDDTPVKVQDRRLDRTRTGRFWCHLGDDEHPYTIFDYTPSRNRDGPMAFLRGWGKHKGVHLQADAFGGYDGIYAGEAGGRVIEVA